MDRLTRREFLTFSALGAGALALPWSGCLTTEGKAPLFTAAFFTDMHVYLEKKAMQGWTKSLHHALSQPHTPDFLLTGGDLAMDILSKDKKRADEQYDLFFQPLQELPVPIHHTIGNHDCLGIYEDSGMSPSDPLYGREYYLKRFNMDNTYYSYDHKGWHFVHLDTIGFDDRSYRGWIDEKQLAWLEADLRSANKPTVISMHIPLLSNAPEWGQGTTKQVSKSWLVVNAHEVLQLLEKFPVKLVLAGHLHINERYWFKGIEFANVGAVSGAWWNGARDGFEEGYAWLEFHEDSVSWKYMDYGWEIAKEEKQEG